MFLKGTFCAADTKKGRTLQPCKEMLLKSVNLAEIKIYIHFESGLGHGLWWEGMVQALGWCRQEVNGQGEWWELGSVLNLGPHTARAGLARGSMG